MKRISEEERHQREKEELSRQRMQDEAYEEAQRAIYARIYRGQMPPERTRSGRTEPYQSRAYDARDAHDDYDTRHDTRYDTRHDARYDARHDARYDTRYDDYAPRRDPRQSGGERHPSKKKKKKRWPKVLLVIFLVLLFLVSAVAVLHAIFIQAPELPTVEEAQSEGTHPALLEAGRKEEVYTFLLVGRDDGGGGNTDTMMVGCYDVKNGTLDVMSLYRDTLVDVPWDPMKLNSVYNYRGLEGLQEEIRDLIGYVPDYYFVLELDIVAQLVDAIGGVDYDVPYNMSYDDPTQDLHIHYDKGVQHLDGEDAVRVLRWRKNNSGESLSVGDIGRVEVQHSFMMALVKQALSFSTLTNIKEIADIVETNLTSNLSYGEIIWFGEHALLMDQNAIHFHNLPGDYTGSLWSPTVGNYQSYVFVNDTALLELVNRCMNPYVREITAEMQHVIYATTVNNMPDAETTDTAAG